MSNKQRKSEAPGFSPLSSRPTDDLLRAIRVAILNEPDKIPPGFKSTAQWGAEWGVSGAQAARLCRRATAKGLLQMIRYNIYIGNAIGLRKIPHYRDARKKTSK